MEMLRGVVYTGFVLFSLISTAAFACEGQVGQAIYEDTFTDDSGAWDFTPNAATVKPPNFVFNLDSKYSNITTQVLTFHTTKDGDYCAEVILPKSIAPDNKYNLGIIFWATDYANFWMVMLSSDGTLTLFSKANNVWQTILSVPNAPAYKSDPDAVNALRVTTVAGKIIIYLNGQLEKAIRAQSPDGNLRFGMYAQIDKGVDGTAPILVKSYKVTSGQ
jgi:hypothetical protein